MPIIYNKVTVGGNTLVDLSQDTVTDASHIVAGHTGHLADGTQVAGTGGGGGGTYQAKTNINPTTSSQTITPDSGYDALSSVQINAMPSGTAGTPTATKGTVSNHSVSVTPSVTNTTGYITGSTKTGTAVTVSASELVSGSETKTANGTYDVTNLAQLIVNVSGSSGLVYETGTYTPTSNISKPQINFANSHTSPPLFVIFTDTTGTDAGTATNTNHSWTYSCWYEIYGGVIIGSTNSYGISACTYGSATSNNIKIINNLTDSSSTSGRPNHVSNTWIKPDSASSARYWISGRTYKWIAVWAPTT